MVGFTDPKSLESIFSLFFYYILSFPSLAHTHTHFPLLFPLFYALFFFEFPSHSDYNRYPFGFLNPPPSLV